ncbi:hypothetical protein HQ489_05770 [Candidatus Woesearchaeota archaeon]|nr:hypothetical protein [Candidatus Woesearchaeota archaeon]
MPKELTPEQVYDNLVTKGLYGEANFDKDEIKKNLKMTIEDYTFAQQMCKQKQPSWRIVFNAHYDILRELCDQLMRFSKQKISNHQGLFAFIILNYNDLEFDWNFFETIRTARNRNKYEGKDISKEMWDQVSLQFKVYISTLKKEIEIRLK